MNARERLASLLEPEPTLRPSVAAAMPAAAFLPDLDNLDSALLPVTQRLPDYNAPTATRAHKQDVVLQEDKAGKLEDLVDLSLDEARKLIEEPWDYSDPRLVSAKSSMIQTIFNTQSKVDETQLRRRQVDMIPKLLELIAEKQKELPSRESLPMRLLEN